MQPSGRVMIASRAPSDTISRAAITWSSSSLNSWPTSSSASTMFGEITSGSARTAWRSGSPSVSTTTCTSSLCRSRIRCAYTSESSPRGSEPAKTTIAAPRARYSSLSRNRSSSASVTAGPRSLISVCSPLVGSWTAVLVRDSSRMRTKSLRIDSAVRCSTIRVPVGPPAKPVAITGWPSAFSPRATLTPLPPGIVVPSTVRWRRPRRKFGTESDLSIAALSVTVMIMRSRSSLVAYGVPAAPCGAYARSRGTRYTPGGRPPRPGGRPCGGGHCTRPSE